ncbi:MAG: hypothetical protein AUK47_00190 [Deltaproteobacteria bacterium CG2_30_63_29]|nr:MAG: hypothetical protein AUK47_00190 [Deltaproteobacteria bacterium CG2_30_63_29]
MFCESLLNELIDGLILPGECLFYEGDPREDISRWLFGPQLAELALHTTHSARDLVEFGRFGLTSSLAFIELVFEESQAIIDLQEPKHHFAGTILDGSQTSLRFDDQRRLFGDDELDLIDLEVDRRDVITHPAKTLAQRDECLVERAPIHVLLRLELCIGTHEVSGRIGEPTFEGECPVAHSEQEAHESYPE